VQVAIPERLTPKQRALMEELAKDLAVETMPEQKGFRDLLKNLFG
jgi:DnaJ-class molecular chaperone